MNSLQNQLRSSSLMPEQAGNLRGNQPPNYRGCIFRVFAILLVVVGSTIWILNIISIIPGNQWSSIFGVIFAVFGVILGLFPPSPRESRAQHPDLPVHQPSVEHSHILLEGVNFDIDDHHGALVVLVNKYLRGSTINICLGFQSVDLRSNAAANVVERRRLDHVSWLLHVFRLERIVYVAFFPKLEPGNYTVYAGSREFFIAWVTIHPRQVTEIDWR